MNPNERSSPAREQTVTKLLPTLGTRGGDTAERIPERPVAGNPPFRTLGERRSSAAGSQPDRGLTVLVLPAAAAALVQNRLAGLPELTVVASDALELGRIPRADLCFLDEAYGADMPSVVRDLTGRVGLQVIAVGDRNPSHLAALRYLDDGADDYLSARATNEEWVARVRAVLRRRPVTPAPDDADLHAGGLTISVDERRVWRDGNAVKLTRTEFGVLTVLARNLDRPVPYARLLTDVWGVERLTARHYLRVYIRRLREKLEADARHPRLITTEWRAGYMLRSRGAQRLAARVRDSDDSTATRAAR